MEQLERRLSFSGLTVDSDPSLRMQARPSGTGIAPGAGRHREDFGSSGLTLSPRKSKINPTRPASTQSTPILVDSSEDDDIDLFPSPPGTLRHKKVRIRNTTASGSKAVVEGPAIVMYDGKAHQYHPDYQPKQKLPKFKKYKSTDQTNDSGNATSSRANISDQPQESSSLPKRPPPVSKQTHQKTDKKSLPSPPQSSQPSSSPSPEIRPKRPRPRPIAKPPKRILRRVDSSDSNNPLGDGVEAEEVPVVRKERPKPTKKLPTKKEFPLLNDPSFHSDQPSRTASNLSPTRSRRSSSETPLVRSHDAKSKDETHVASASETEGNAPQPFPLTTAFMDSTPKAAKRHPEDESHGGGSERKKLKESLPSGLSPGGFPGSIGNQSSDFFFIDPNVDPSTLCPWCDQQLPTDPTPRLKSLMETVRSKSYASPRPSNPLGLGAALTASVAVCQRHRFESYQIPKAQAKGWPTNIDFGKVKPRVEAMRPRLDALLSSKPSDADGLVMLNECEGNPRDDCPFWTGIVKEIKSKGARAVASSTGQFASFKALQPGYYGELGYLIIHQTIYQLFPPDTIDPDSTAPLTPSDFIQRILVPEAAVCLIMEDLQSTYLNAIKTLRESVEYGVAMFPDTGDNEEGIKAADDVVKERARLRRKQLLQEEMENQERDSSEMEVELALSRHSSPPMPITPKKSRSKRGNAGTNLVTETSESERDMVVIDELQIFTQRPPTAKSWKPTSGYRSDASNVSNASVASRTRSVTRKQSSKPDARTTQPSDLPSMPSFQPLTRQESAFSYRAKTPSDRSSDVEIISDHSTRSTRSRTRGGPKNVPQQALKNSNSAGKRQGDPAPKESTPDTDTDDELLKSSPFNVKRHVSHRRSSTEMEDLDVDETPKLQKFGKVKSSTYPRENLKTPTRQPNRSGSQSSQDLSHLVAND